MRLEKTSTLTTILAQGNLNSLRERAGQIKQLDSLLGFYLDQRLRQWVQVAAYHEGTLTLACSNSTIAGQLRYLSRIYTQQLRQHGEFCDLKRINAVIKPAIPASHTSALSHPPLRRLSPVTAELLVTLSDDLADEQGGGEISEALRRLARHVEAGRGPEKDDSP